MEKFGLDKNCLLSRGLSHGEIQKLYECLFAHSMGFNNRLKDLTLNSTTMKSIWKVYAILLEYCSEGIFETTVGEIERDMQKKEAMLLSEIEKRQKMIDNTDERMEERLSKYERENRELKKELDELSQKHDMMMGDYHEMDMSFNTEVNLRLSYEHKINKIYSIHERLNIVHLNLFKDFEATDQVNQKVTK